MVHACGQGNCSAAMGHSPHFMVHMYLAASSKASALLCVVLIESMMASPCVHR